MNITVPLLRAGALVALALTTTSPALAQPVYDWDATAVVACQKLQRSATDCLNTLVTRSVNNIAFSAPLVITKGGTYSGAWISTDPKVNAITISTTEPVVISNSTIVGAGTLIYGRGVNATISNVSGFGLGTAPGKFLDATVNNSLVVQGNRMSNVWGTRVSGASPATLPSLTFTQNISYNIAQTSGDPAHFLQLVNGGFPGAIVSNNVSINAPGKSHVEDVINIYNSFGTAAKHITVSENYILGAYPVNPATDGFSGGGIIVDGGGIVTPATSAAYVDITDNVVLDTTNYGVAISSGHNNTLKNNTVISAGVFANNIPVKSQNVGLYIWNINKQTADIFYGNQSIQNSVYWLKAQTATPTRNPWWMPDCQVLVANGCSNVELSKISTVPGALGIEAVYLNKFFGGL